MFAVFHPDAIDLFSVCSSLEKVTKLTYNVEYVGLHDLQ